MTDDDETEQVRRIDASELLYRIVDAVTERDHLRRQRDELQAANTALLERARKAEGYMPDGPADLAHASDLAHMAHVHRGASDLVDLKARRTWLTVAAGHITKAALALHDEIGRMEKARR